MATRRKFVQTSAGMMLLSTAVAEMVQGCSGGGGSSDDASTSPTPTPNPTPTPSVVNGVMSLPLTDYPVLAGADGAAAFNVPPAGKIIVAHLDAGTGTSDYVCLSSTCTHQGCTVSYTAASNRLSCPCHGSVYDAVTGSVLAGPAPLPLHVYTTTFDGSTVTVDLNT